MSQASDLKRIAGAPGRLDLMGAPEGFDALVMADIVRARKNLCVFVARDGARLSAFAEAFGFFASQVEVLTFPAGHGFNSDRRDDFDQQCADLAFRETLRFLEKQSARLA